MRGAGGPVEAAILEELRGVVAPREVPAGGTTFRVLEGVVGAGSAPGVHMAPSAPLVFLHGRGGAATLWAPWLLRAGELLPAGPARRVIALDLPGFGSTPAGQLRPGGAEEGLSYFVEPTATALAALRVEAPILIGHSLGGLVALELALRGAVAPAAMILIAPMGVGPHLSPAARLFFLAGPERLARALGPRLYARIAPLPPHPWAARLGALQHELAAVPGGRPVPTAAFDRMVPIAGPAFHRLERLGEIAAPTLILWGDHDPVFPAPAALVAAAALPRGQATLHPLGHSPHLEDLEAPFTDARRFLASIPSLTRA